MNSTPKFESKCHIPELKQFWEDVGSESFSSMSGDGSGIYTFEWTNSKNENYAQLIIDTNVKTNYANFAKLTVMQKFDGSGLHMNMLIDLIRQL